MGEETSTGHGVDLSHTNKENKTVGRWLDIDGAVDRDETHARNNWTDKIYVENGVNVDEVEDDRNG